MSAQKSSAVAVARAHVAACGDLEYDKARASLAPDVHVLAISVDPEAPETDLGGRDVCLACRDIAVSGQIVCTRDR